MPLNTLRSVAVHVFACTLIGVAAHAKGCQDRLELELDCAVDDRFAPCCRSGRAYHTGHQRHARCSLPAQFRSTTAALPV